MEKKASFSKRIFNAGSWSVISYGTSQVLRFASNLLLTRLLYPEAFGIMAIVQAVMFGFVMLSDFGIMHCVIRREQEPDENFLNTAWTFQIIQGIIISILFSAIPPLIASIYTEPLLMDIMPVVGLNALLTGFQSTNAMILTRKLHIKIVVLFDLAQSFIGTFILVFLAWQLHSIWALVWGGILGTSIRTITSHFFLEGIKHKIKWDNRYAKEIVDFGKWIIARSSLTFIDGEGNKLIMGVFLGIKTLSFFNLASTINTMVWQLIQSISGRILVSVYSEIIRERPERLYTVLLKCRLAFISAGWLATLFFIFFGNELMNLLYDDRYTDSGKILQMLAIGSLMGNLNGSYAHLLTALGRIRASTFLLVIKIVIQLFSIVSGYYFFGESGVIMGVAFGEWLYYPFNTFYYAKIGFWQPRIDLTFLFLSLLITGFMYTNTDLFATLFTSQHYGSDIWQIFHDLQQALLAKFLH